MSDEWVWRLLVLCCFYFAIRAFCHKQVNWIDSLWIAIALTFAAMLAKGLYTRERVSYAEKEYIVVAKKPPMFLWVSVKDKETGVIHENLSVAKHCMNHENIRIGDVYKLKETVYRFPNGRIVTSIDTYNLFLKCLKDY